MRDLLLLRSYPIWLGGNSRAAAAIKAMAASGDARAASHLSIHRRLQARQRVVTCDSAPAGAWPVLVAWEHVNIQYLTKGVSNDAGDGDVDGDDGGGGLDPRDQTLEWIRLLFQFGVMMTTTQCECGLAVVMVS